MLLMPMVTMMIRPLKQKDVVLPFATDPKILKSTVGFLKKFSLFYHLKKNILAAKGKYNILFCLGLIMMNDDEVLMMQLYRTVYLACFILFSLLWLCAWDHTKQTDKHVALEK